MTKQSDNQVLVSGRYFTEQELQDVKETIRMFPKLSLTELANTICENLDWVTPTGKNKIESCRQFLEKLEGDGLINLPAKQEYRSRDTNVRIEFRPYTAPGQLIKGNVSDFEPIGLEPIRSRDSIRLWNEYVHRYHALGYKRPFGAHQRYFITSEASQKPLGCLLFAAAAWALTARDEWISWTQTDRSLRLNLIVNNTRFLIFPWVCVKNLASKSLSLAAKRIRSDWQERYGYKPVLLETFVNPEKYRGTCYQAANWIYLGKTAGRGRMDRHKKRALTPKDIYVYPLVTDFRSYLKGETADE